MVQHCPTDAYKFFNIRFHSLAYLHEETKPPVIHFNLKSSNVLVDQQWNPKISNIATTKLLGPEYDCTHVGDERSDVYNFGVLIMEIVSGKTAIQTYGNEIEVLINLTSRSLIRVTLGYTSCTTNTF